MSGTTRLCFDSTNPNAIPADAEMVLVYVDGANTQVVEAWREAAAGRFASALKVRVACLASTDDGDLLDVEQGNATPGSAPGWVQRRRAAGVDPGVYVNLSNWPAVRAAFHAAGVAEPHYWLAEYDNDPTLPAGADAKQYANEPLTGGNYDLSIVSPDWPQGDAMTLSPSMKQAFARLAYLAALGREPSVADLENWAGQIADDGGNADQIVAQIADSAEGQAHLAALRQQATASTTVPPHEHSGTVTVK